MLDDCEKNQEIFNNLLNVFALVRRGNCNFEEKAWNVQQAGFLGAIIYDPNNDGVIVMHGSHQYALNIPSMYRKFKKSKTIEILTKIIIFF